MMKSRIESAENGKNLLTELRICFILLVVTKFQILVRTGTAGGPEGPPLILPSGRFYVEAVLEL